MDRRDFLAGGLALVALRPPRPPKKKRRRVITHVPASGSPTANGTALQNAITAAAFGDTITLDAGGVYQRDLNLPDKGAGSGTDADYITIRPASLEGLPPAGQRVNPLVHGLAMPRILGNGPPAITVAAGAHHWQCLGLEVTNTQTNLSTMLVTVFFLAHHLIFDRLWVHNPESTLANLYPAWGETWASRGMALNGSEITLVNSWIGAFAGVFPGGSVVTDSYGVLIQQSTGAGILIQNNQIDAYFNNVFMTGGGIDPSKTAVMSSVSATGATVSNTTGLAIGSIMAVQVPDGYDDGRGLAPCFNDINNPKCWQAVRVTAVAGAVITWEPYGVGGLNTTPVSGGAAQWDGYNIDNVRVLRNTLYKNPAWGVAAPGYAKDYIELKSATNCVYRGNIFAGSCCAAIAFENAQACSNGGCPWTTINNQLFEHNLLKEATNAIFLPVGVTAQASSGNIVSSVPGFNIVIRNNLWSHLTSPCGSANVSGIFQTAGGHDVTISHNTIRNINIVDAVIHVGGELHGQTNLSIRDNIFNYGSSGFAYNTPGGYTVAWPPGGIVEDGNIVITDGTLTNDPAGAGQVPSSYRVMTNAAVGFVDFASADAGGDYHGLALAPSSTFKNGGTDGTDPGVNFAALDAALAGDQPAPPSRRGGAFHQAIFRVRY